MQCASPEKLIYNKVDLFTGLKLSLLGRSVALYFIVSFTAPASPIKLIYLPQGNPNR